MRLFAAVNLPEEVKEKISKELLCAIPENGFKAVEKQNLHITMHFIGECAKENAQKIYIGIRGIRFEEFEASAEGIGVFGGRVIWLGVGKGAEKISEIARQVFSAAGVKEERFHAHITLARNKKAERGEVLEVARKLEGKKFLANFKVGKVSLMESRLTSQGPVYSEVSESTFSSSGPGS